MKNKKAKLKRPSPNNESSLEQAAKFSLAGLAITVAISAALLLLGTAIAISTVDPLSLIAPIGYVSTFISAILGGFACAKLNKRSPYACAALCGGEFVLLSMLLSFALPHTLASGMTVWTRLAIHVASLVAFPLGALLGVKASKPKRKKRR